MSPPPSLSLSALWHWWGKVSSLLAPFIKHHFRWCLSHALLSSWAARERKGGNVSPTKMRFLTAYSLCLFLKKKKPLHSHPSPLFPFLLSLPIFFVPNNMFRHHLPFCAYHIGTYHKKRIQQNKINIVYYSCPKRQDLACSHELFS